MKKLTLLLILFLSVTTFANVKISADRSIKLYRIGDRVTFYLEGTQGAECEIEVTSKEHFYLKRIKTLPCEVIVKAIEAGPITLTANYQNKTTKFEVFVNYEEPIVKGSYGTRMEHYQRYGHVVNDYYVKKFRALNAKRQTILNNLKTKEDAQKYVTSVRKKIRDAFNIDAIKRCDLNPQITKKYSFKSYDLENVIFESRKNFYVTNNLFLPKNPKGKVPAILMLCGHSLSGKMYSVYAKLCATLASNGVACIITDPISQGERWQYTDTSKTEITYGHNELGKKLHLSGEWFGTYRAYDAIRAIDYLISRKDIDQSKIFVTGCSGGGTVTTWVNALDDRIAGAIPSCYVTSWKNIVENELPIDAEQCPPYLAGMNLDISDFFIAAAPRPFLLLGAENDFFDIRGFNSAINDIKKVYSLLGAKDSAASFIAKGGHGYSYEQQEECFKQIAKWTKLPYNYHQSKVEIPTAAQRTVTAKSNVKYLPNAKFAEDIAWENRKKVIAQSPKLEGDKLIAAILDNLQVPAKIEVPYYRVLRLDFIKEMLIYINRYLLENNNYILGELQKLTYLHAENQVSPKDKAFIYVGHWNLAYEFPYVISSMKKQFDSYYSFSPWGVGALQSSSCDTLKDAYNLPYHSDYHFASLGIMLGESYLGKRVEGILSAIALLKSRGVKEITICGAGRSAISVAFASLIAKKDIKETILLNPLASYESITNEMTDWAQAEMPWNILKVCDLPQIYKAINAKIITVPFANVK